MVLLPIHFLREVTGFPVTKTFLLAIAALSNQLEDAFLVFQCLAILEISLLVSLSPTAVHCCEILGFH